jgi:hypothetical protein
VVSFRGIGCIVLPSNLAISALPSAPQIHSLGPQRRATFQALPSMSGRPADAPFRPYRPPPSRSAAVCCMFSNAFRASNSSYISGDLQPFGNLISSHSRMLEIQPPSLEQPLRGPWLHFLGIERTFPAGSGECGCSQVDAAHRRNDIIELPSESLTVLPAGLRVSPKTLCSVRCINRDFRSL